MRIDVRLNFSEEEIFQYFKDNGWSNKPPYRKLTESELKNMSDMDKEYLKAKAKNAFESCVSRDLGKFLKRMVLDPKGHEREQKIDAIIN